MTTLTTAIIRSTAAVLNAYAAAIEADTTSEAKTEAKTEVVLMLKALLGLLTAPAGRTAPVRRTTEPLTEAKVPTFR